MLAPLLGCLRNSIGTEFRMFFYIVLSILQNDAEWHPIVILQDLLEHSFACTFLYMYLHVHVRLWTCALCTCTFMYVHLHVHIPSCTGTFMFRYLHVQVPSCTGIFMCGYLHVYVPSYTGTFTNFEMSDVTAFKEVECFF